MSGAVIGVFARPAGTLQVAVAPGYISGFKSSPGTVNSLSTAVASVTGGQPPYTYLWNRVSGSSVIYASSPTGPNTDFYSFFSSIGSRSSTWTVTVTDAASSSATSGAINVDMFCGFIP
jgi:hypothetical protein